jgi:hypothetical protein
MSATTASRKEALTQECAPRLAMLGSASPCWGKPLLRVLAKFAIGGG